jgi:hypothetical protein
VSATGGATAVGALLLPSQPDASAITMHTQVIWAQIPFMNETARMSRRRGRPESLRVARGWAAASVILALASCGGEPTTFDGEDSQYWTSVPVQFANLQVLPETIERDELILNMRTISRSLGVRCGHCHDMATEDYERDDLDAKRIARDMMRMVEEFNILTADRPEATQVTCFMCHRGAKSPPRVDLPPLSDA